MGSTRHLKSIKKNPTPILEQVSETGPIEMQGAKAEGVIRALLKQAQQITGTGDVFIVLPYAPNDFRVHAAQGCFASFQDQAIQNSCGPIQAACTKGRRLILNEPTRPAPDCVIFRESFSALALLPLRVSSNLFAVLGVVHRDSGRVFSETEIEHLDALADLGSMSLQGLWMDTLLKQERDRAQWLESEIQSSGQILHQLAGNMSQCFWVEDTARNSALYVSANFETLLGFPVDRMRSDAMAFCEMLFPDDKDRVLSALHTAPDGEIDIEFRVIRSDGEVRWIWLRRFAHLPDDPEDTQIMSIADDITDKKLKDEKIRLKEVGLAAASKMIALGVLASGVAHEINNPLTIIFGRATELRKHLQSSERLDEKGQILLDRIESTAMRISSIISSLKSFARDDRQVAIQKVRLNHVFAEVQDLCRERFRKHQVELILPEIPDTLQVEFHPTQLGQVILNLLNNAHDAVIGHEERWVKIEWAEDNDSVFLYVTDSGHGIPIKDRGQIFEPFYTTKPAGQGTGLGLSLSRKIVEQFDGALRLDTNHSRTRFVLQLMKTLRPAKAA